MKKFIFLIAMTGISAGVFSQPLFTYGNTAVDKDEFIRAYNRNKTPANDKGRHGITARYFTTVAV